jgi:hypothetical protein
MNNMPTLSIRKHSLERSLTIRYFGFFCFYNDTCTCMCMFKIIITIQQVHQSCIQVTCLYAYTCVYPAFMTINSVFYSNPGIHQKLASCSSYYQQCRWHAITHYLLLLSHSDHVESKCWACPCTYLNSGLLSLCCSNQQTIITNLISR